MKYAQIKNGSVRNTIVLDNLEFAELLLEGFDALIRIDELDPVPGIGWSYDGLSNTFSNQEGE